MEQRYTFKFTTKLNTVINVVADNKKTAEDIALKSYGFKLFEDMEVESTNCELINVRPNQFCIGDFVKVINTGANYSSYPKFFEDNNLSDNIANRYQCDYDVDQKKSLSIKPLNQNDTYVILFSGKHMNDNSTTVYVIENLDNHLVYLIGEYGIELI